MDIINFIQSRNLTRHVILGFSLFVLLLIFQKFFVILLLIGLSLMISFVIGTYQMAKSVGIELVTFTAILTGAIFGPALGALVGFILITLHFIIGHFAAGLYVLWVMPSYVALGFLAGTLTGFDFVTLGVFMTLGMNIFNLVLTSILFSSNLANYLPFSITNIIFNLILFYQIGPIVYGLLK